MEKARQILREKPTHVAAWGFTLGAAALACAAFPAISANSNAARLHSPEGVSAQAFLNSSVNPASEKSASSRLASSSLAATLAHSSAAPLAAARPAGAALIAQAKHTAAEHKCLSQAVYYEARSEARAGQKAVAEVVLNRVKSRHYPNTICGVVFQGSQRSTGCQFSFTCDGSLARGPQGKMWTRSSDIASLAMTGGVSPLTGSATHYHNLDVTPVWSDTLVMTKTVGTHKFYRTKWRERNISRSAVLAAPPSP